MNTRAIDPARSRIVLIGVPAYKDPALPDVPVVAKNIADLAEVFTDPDLGGFDPAHCLIAPRHADREQIGDLLHTAAEQAEDLLLLYYSGHGLLDPIDRELFLSLAGSRPDRLDFTALSYESVRRAFRNVEPGVSKVVILDSCFSGRAISTDLSVSSDAVMEQVHVEGTYTLVSTPANRTALILKGEEHTAFTGRLLKLLRTGSPNAGLSLSLGDVYLHLHKQLRSEGLPAPQQRGTGTADLLGLVRNVSTPTVPMPAPPPVRHVEAVSAARSREKLAITVLTESGGQHARVTTEELAGLVRRIGNKGDNFLIVERIPDRRGYFMQAWHDVGGEYSLEHRDGAPDRHFRTELEGPERVIAAIASWARQEDGWGGLQWEREDVGSWKPLSSLGD